MKKVLIAIIIILLIISSFIVVYFLKDSSPETETLSINLSIDLGDETWLIERNNNLKEVKIDTNVNLNLDLSKFLAETATASCYVYQEIFFGDKEIKFDHIPSEEEKEYSRKANEFLEGYDLKQVIVRVKATNGGDGFDCVLRGIDDTKNTMALISGDGLRYSLTLDKAKQQYIS